MKLLVAILFSLTGISVFANERIGQGSAQSENCADCASASSTSYGDYRDDIAKSWRKSRGLYAIPTDDKHGYQASVCHSGHHNPNFSAKEFTEDSNGVHEITLDTYASGLGACVYMSILQEWRKTYCPEGGGCRVSLGAVSHKNLRFFDGLKSHTNGECFNVRPMQKGEFTDNAINYKTNSNYDPAKTRQFVQLLRDKGVRDVWFNDVTTGAKSGPGLDNVINFCIRGGDAQEKTCKDFKYDESICGAQGSLSL